MKWPRVISRDPDLTDGVLQRVHLLVQLPDPLLFSCVDAGLSRTLCLWVSVGNRVCWLLLHKEKGTMFGPLCHVTPDRFNTNANDLTILHKCSSSCLLSDFSRLPIS